MLAISLYRGNLHRVPAVPRQWLMPTPKISLKDFKILLHRRSRALARLSSSSTSLPTTSNPNPSPYLNQEEDATPCDDVPNGLPQLDLPKVVDPEEEVVKVEALEAVDGLVKLHDQGEVKDRDALEGLYHIKSVVPDNISNPVETHGVEYEEKIEAPLDPDSEVELGAMVSAQANQHFDAGLSPGIASPNMETCNLGAADKEKMKREVEEKLQILNERKHKLVQVLKQILNAEEELRRRSSMPGMAGRPSGPLQVDVTNDSGSMSRQLTPRLGSDGNIIGDTDGADAEDGSNQNLYSRNLLRMSSMSPSSDSPHRKPFSAVLHPAQATLGVGSSPSRFAPTGQQGNPPSLTTVSVSGTNYIASSPSPAGSGGTSVFRDARLPSPWN